MFGHEPLPRHHIERLGDILTDLGEIAATTARARGRRRMNNAPTRQIGRKVDWRRDDWTSNRRLGVDRGRPY
jgi:hypothetical protein